MNFNSYFLRSILVGTLTVGSTSALAVEERQISILEFNELTVSEGLDVTVECGTEPSVLVRGKKSVLDDIEIDEIDGRLVASIWKVDLGLISSKHAELHIITNKPIRNIEAIKGSRLDVHECAIAKDIVRVSAGMGAELSLEGRVNHLELELAMGASFNNRESEFFVKTAKVEATMGVDAYLCNADYVQGEQAFGAAIHIGRETISDIENGFGSEVDYRKCE